MPFFFVFFSWKWWGKKLTNYLTNSTPEKQRDTLEKKIQSLKEYSKTHKELKQALDQWGIPKTK